MEKYEFNLILKTLGENSKVHISRNNRKFYNGYVIFLEEEYINFKDDILGSIPLPYKQIIDIEPCINKNDKHNKRRS